MKSPLKKMALSCFSFFSASAFAVSNDAIINSAPVVIMHSQEIFLPSSVEFFLQNVHQEGEFLVTNQKLKHPSDYSIPMLLGESLSNNTPPVYAIVVPKPNLGSEVTDVHYFFFYPYNRGKRVCIGKFISGLGCIGGYSTFGNHIGNWENIRIRFYNDAITSINFSAHDYTNEYWPSDVMFHGKHPVVYSALGSHGSYPRSGNYVYKKLPNDDLVDKMDNGVEWHTYNNVKIIPFHPVGSYPEEFGFMNFTGRWGNPRDTSKCAFGQCVLEQGPTGPAMKAAVDPLAP